MPCAPVIKVNRGNIVFTAGCTSAPMYHSHSHVPEESDNMRIPSDWRGSLKDGRLLVLSLFPSTQRRPTAELAAQRNDLVADLAHQVFIAHAPMMHSKIRGPCRLVRNNFLSFQRVRRRKDNSSPILPTLHPFPPQDTIPIHSEVECINRCVYRSPSKSSIAFLRASNASSVGNSTFRPSFTNSSGITSRLNPNNQSNIVLISIAFPDVFPVLLHYPASSLLRARRR